MHTITSPTGTTVQPQRARRRKGVGFWAGRILLGLVITLVALVTTGAIYQAVATAIDQRSYPPLCCDEGLGRAERRVPRIARDE